ncbi:sporulation protein YunB [Clostridium swellfunianum]|uniref:sporulation protein YunB n=1 Tax=Clostridium swellfunianum TaxID=1367462 RepID=UPI0025469CD8|nr:sporulation protein YunB [Clostridium swellfunianum]
MDIIKGKTKFKIVFFVTVLLLMFNVFIYTLDKVITPTVIAVANAEMRAKSMEIINTAVLNEYSKQFKYEDVINVEKDREGNITLLKADTLKMNKIANDVALNSQKELKKLGSHGIKVPIGYILQNNILASIGPSVGVNMEPIGYIETRYQSEFESAGINQTRHKIYVQVYAKLRIIIPMKNDDIEVKSEVPIAETIIIGKVPDTSINLDLDKAGTKINTSGTN